MRILHVHDIAHIPPLIVRVLEEKGIASSFVEDVGNINIKDFDIVHAHYALNRKTIRAFRAARRHKIPFVLHCHGSDVRRVTATGLRPLPPHYQQISQYMRRRSAKVFLSTPDLIPFAPEGEYVPNPVDIGAFRPMPEVKKCGRKLIAGTFFKGENISRFIEPDVEYDCINVKGDYEFPANVVRHPVVPHERLAPFLNRYSEMLGTFNDLISMTRLEAMACGLRTFTNFDRSYSRFYDGVSPDGAPDPRAFVERFHGPEVCVSRLIRAYDKILSG